MFSPPWGDRSGVPPWQLPCEGWDGGAMGTVQTLGFGGGESKTALTVLTCPQQQGTAVVGGTCGTSRGWGNVSECSGAQAHPIPRAGAMGTKLQG